MDNAPVRMSLRIKVLLGILVFGALFFTSRVLRYFGEGTATASIPRLTQTGVLAQFSNGRDSDHDGIADAEEASYEGDPFNHDTDGDGFLDGEEVMTGHNPANKEDHPGAQTDPTNVTQSYLDKLIGGYLAGDLNYEKADPNTFAKGMDILSYATIQDLGNSNDSVTIPDPILTDDSSPEAVRQYLTTIAKALNIIPTDDSYFTGNIGDDTVAVDQASAKHLYMLGLVLDRVGTKIAQTPTPHEMVSWQSQMVRSMKTLSKTYYALAMADQDPMKAMAQFGSFPDAFVNFFDLGASFNDMLTEHRIPLQVKVFQSVQTIQSQ